MFRLLIESFRPTETQLRKRKPSSSLRLKMWIHRCLVKVLAHFYRRYAVYDILNMKDGYRVEIELRDPGFEKEMAYAKLVTNQQLQPIRNLPKENKTKRRGISWFYGCFNWQHKVTIHDTSGHALLIDHTTRTTLSGDLGAFISRAKSDSRLDTVMLAFSHDTRRSDNSAPSQQEPLTPVIPCRPASSRRRRVPPPSVIPASVVSGNTPVPEKNQPEEKGRHTNTPVAIPHVEMPFPNVDKQQEPESTETPKPTQPLKRMKGFDVDDSF